jgi:hypothetical protein
MRTPDFNLREAYSRTLDENEKLHALAFPELGSVFKAAWPVPLNVKSVGTGQASVFEFTILPTQMARPTDKTFTEFLALGAGYRSDDGSPAQTKKVLRFASKFGPLRLRRDGAFLFHPNGRQEERNGKVAYIATEPVGLYVGRARVSLCLIGASRKLRRMTRELKKGSGYIGSGNLGRFWSSLDEISRSVEFDRRLNGLGRQPNPEDISRIAAEVAAAKPDRPKTVDACWRLVMECLETVLGSNPFGLPMIFTLEKDTSIRLRPVSSLNTYLQIHILTAVGKSPGVTVCSGCGQVFTPRRQIPADREAWCPKCGVKAAQRAASRRYYQNNKTQVLDRVHRARRKEIQL